MITLALHIDKNFITRPKHLNPNSLNSHILSILLFSWFTIHNHILLWTTIDFLPQMHDSNFFFNFSTNQSNVKNLLKFWGSKTPPKPVSNHKCIHNFSRLGFNLSLNRNFHSRLKISFKSPLYLFTFRKKHCLDPHSTPPRYRFLFIIIINYNNSYYYDY